MPYLLRKERLIIRNLETKNSQILIFRKFKDKANKSQGNLKRYYKIYENQVSMLYLLTPRGASKARKESLISL